MIVLIGLTAMLLIYQGLGQVTAAMQDLAETRGPSSAAAYEMEIQLHAISVAVLRYLDTGDATLRAEVNMGDAQFVRFRDQYRRLATTAEERSLVEQIDGKYERFKQLARELLAAREGQEQRYTDVVEKFEELDRILEKRVTATLPAATAFGRMWGGSAPAELVLKMEAEVAEVGLWLANYHRVPKPEYRARIFAKEQDVRRALRRLRATLRSGDQQRSLMALELALNETVGLINETLAQSRRCACVHVTSFRFERTWTACSTTRSRCSPCRRFVPHHRPPIRRSVRCSPVSLCLCWPS